MNSDRFIAFYDAMLAIIMTIIVLTFDVPQPDSWKEIEAMIPSFICYAVSFFWIGIMWISSYIAWRKVKRVSPRSLFFMLVSLFASSFFPFATAMIGKGYDSLTAQAFYGIVVFAITGSNILLTRSINQDHPEPVLGALFTIPPHMTWIDFLIKAVGMILCIFVWPPFMSLSVLLAVVVLTVRLFIQARIRSKINCNENSTNNLKSKEDFGF